MAELHTLQVNQVQKKSKHFEEIRDRIHNLDFTIISD